MVLGQFSWSDKKQEEREMKNFEKIFHSSKTLILWLTSTGFVQEPQLFNIHKCYFINQIAYL